MEDHKQSTEVDARRVFESLQQATLARDHKISDLFADDGVIEWPFARPGAPKRIGGHSAIRGLYEAWFRTSPLEYLTFAETVVYETQTRGVLVVEYEIHGVNTYSRTPFRLRVIRTVHVEDGRIKLLREYINPLAMEEALR